MSSPFEFATATRIIFGEGTSRSLGDLVRSVGDRPLLVTGSEGTRTAFIASSIDAQVFPVSGEPTVQMVRDGAKLAGVSHCDVVVSIGGGSVIDTGKAIAAVATNGGEPLDFLEVVGAGRALEEPPIPFIAVPTTAGTGSEVTRNAVLGSPEHGIKASLRSPLMLPRIAVVDPELTYTLPPDLTAYTGLDALTQLIEPYVSSRGNPLIDAVCLEGIRRAAPALQRVFRDGNDRQARSEMALASLFGGLALANAGLGVVHAFASPIGGMWTAPHGALCAALLPFGMAANISALRARAPHHPALERYDQVARLLTGESRAAAEDGIGWTRALLEELRIPSLRHWGISVDDLPEVAEKARNASSMKANPIALNEDELLGVLSAAL